ncbi:MAG: restriction endonuclease subunit S [Clostridia bacterium]|nr:restriction endonuclease subunit S [Clostridia bacterium]
MKLGEIAKVSSGLVVARKKANLDPKYKYRMLTLRSFEEEGWLNINHLEEFGSSEIIKPQYLTEKGDIIVRLSSPNTAVSISDGLEGLLIPSLFAIIRLTSDRINPEYLTLYLNSEAAKKQFIKESFGTALTIIRTSFLKDIEIKEQSVDKQRKLEHITRLYLQEKKLLKDLAREKEKLYRSILQKYFDPREEL